MKIIEEHLFLCLNEWQSVMKSKLRLIQVELCPCAESCEWTWNVKIWCDIQVTFVSNSQNTDLRAPEGLRHEKYFVLIQEKNIVMFVRHIYISMLHLKSKEWLVVEILPCLPKYFKLPIHDCSTVAFSYQSHVMFLDRAWALSYEIVTDLITNSVTYISSGCIVHADIWQTLSQLVQAHHLSLRLQRHHGPLWTVCNC